VVLLRAVVVTGLAAGCETSIYYPVPLQPTEDWVPACAGPIDATVTVENVGEHPVDVHELLPYDDCPPSARGTVGPGETADLGVATGRIWRTYDAETREWLGTFELVDGVNILAVP
jgi:hypothetical protein